MVMVQTYSFGSMEKKILYVATIGWLCTLINVFGTLTFAIQFHNNIRSDGLITDKHLNISANFSLSWILVIQIGYSLISLISCILLVAGDFKNSRYYFLPWIIISFKEYITFSLLTLWIAKLNIDAVYSHTHMTGHVFILFMISLFISTHSWYLWVVVYRYFVHLKDDEPIAYISRNVYNRFNTSHPPPYRRMDPLIA